MTQADQLESRLSQIRREIEEIYGEMECGLVDRVEELFALHAEQHSIDMKLAFDGMCRKV